MAARAMAPPITETMNDVQNNLSYRKGRAGLREAPWRRKNIPFRPGLMNFFYGSASMNMDATQSASRAAAWVARSCGDIIPIAAAFSREHSFAYGSSGLNMNGQDAIRYAAGRISPMTPCPDLLQVP